MLNLMILKMVCVQGSSSQVCLLQDEFLFVQGDCFRCSRKLHVINNEPVKGE